MSIWQGKQVGKGNEQVGSMPDQWVQELAQLSARSAQPAVCCCRREGVSAHGDCGLLHASFCEVIGGYRGIDNSGCGVRIANNVPLTPGPSSRFVTKYITVQQHTLYSSSVVPRHPCASCLALASSGSSCSMPATLTLAQQRLPALRDPHMHQLSL